MNADNNVVAISDFFRKRDDALNTLKRVMLLMLMCGVGPLSTRRLAARRMGVGGVCVYTSTTRSGQWTNGVEGRCREEQCR